MSPIHPGPREFLAAGVALIPIPLGEKGPRCPGWQRREAAVFGTENAHRFENTNAGILHEWSRTCAIDIDDYDAADAWLTPRGINLEHLFCAHGAVSITSGLPNRGKLLYRLPDSVEPPPTIKIKTDHARVILEFRCAGSQDVVAGKHPGGTDYTVNGDPATMPALPDELLELWRSQLTRSKAPAEKRANTGPRIASGGRNEALTREAGRLRHMGYSAETIGAALQQINAERCEPPLPEREVDAIARSIGARPPGEERTLDAANGNGVDRQPAIYTAAELAQRPATERKWIVDQWLPARANAAIGGHGGTGKSILMAMLAVCVASGRPFYRLAVSHGLVLIYACEDEADEWKFRLQCAAAYLGVDFGSLPIIVIDALEFDGNPALFAPPATDAHAGAMVMPVGAWLAEQVKVRRPCSRSSTQRPTLSPATKSAVAR